jgi:hypothetical protein
MTMKSAALAARPTAMARPMSCRRSASRAETALSTRAGIVAKTRARSAAPTMMSKPTPAADSPASVAPRLAAGTTRDEEGGIGLVATRTVVPSSARGAWTGVEGAGFAFGSRRAGFEGRRFFLCAGCASGSAVGAGAVAGGDTGVGGGDGAGAGTGAGSGCGCASATPGALKTTATAAIGTGKAFAADPFRRSAGLLA